MLAATPERDSPLPGQTRIQLPFAPLVRGFAWTLEAVSLLFAGLSLFAPPGDAPWALVLLASLAVALMSELLRTGCSEIIVTAESRRVSGGLRTRAGPVPMLYFEAQLPMGTELGLRRIDADGHTMYELHLPAGSKGRGGLMHFHTREEAELVREWVREALRPDQ